MTTVREGRIMMQASLSENGEMRGTGMAGVSMRWAAKALKPLRIALLSNITRAQAGQFRQGTAALDALSRISGIR